MTLHVTVTKGHMTRPRVTHQSHDTMEDSGRFWKKWCYIIYIIYVNLKIDT